MKNGLFDDKSLLQAFVSKETEHTCTTKQLYKTSPPTTQSAVKESGDIMKIKLQNSVLAKVRRGTDSGIGFYQWSWDWNMKRRRPELEKEKTKNESEWHQTDTGYIPLRESVKTFNFNNKKIIFDLRCYIRNKVHSYILMITVQYCRYVLLE